MTTVTIEDPEKVMTKRVGENGQVYVGKDLADIEVELVVSRKDE